jgi:hypothetical protein
MLESQYQLPVNSDQLGGLVDVFAEKHKFAAAELFRLLNKAINNKPLYGEVPPTIISELVKSDEFIIFICTIAQYPELEHLIFNFLPFDTSTVPLLWSLFKDALELQTWSEVQKERIRKKKLLSKQAAGRPPQLAR